MFGFAATPANRMTALAVKSPNELSIVDQSAFQSKVNQKATANSLVTQSTGWSIVSSPNINTPSPQTTFINAVTCTSVADCWAVGYHNDGNGLRPLIQRWNGSSWAIVTSPNIGHDAILNSVTCASASECWAVGSVGLIERWNGSSWAVVASPSIDPLSGVTCASTSDCWAVGYYYAGGIPQTLIERWNGSSWIIFASPNTSSTESNALNGVTCASPSDCWAVGGTYNSNTGSHQTLIERWNGSSWTIVTSPIASGGFSSVTCTLVSDCWAVGSYNTNTGVYPTLIEHWDGASWAIVTSPDAGALQDVACTSVSECWAVSSTGLIDRWNGSSWGIATSPNAAGLSGVACASASECWAVGYGIERWNGVAWDIITFPHYGDTQDNELVDVTCASASECWAVGDYYFKTLIQRWDGTSWTVASSPGSGRNGEEQLKGVACASGSQCWSVGNVDFYQGGIVHYPGTYYGSFFEQWNGSSWNLATSATIIDTIYHKLNGVTCASASDCWAVGSDATPIERWNGSSWAIVNAPTRAPLNGVTCVSASECWAVGHISYYLGNDRFLEQTLIERWNGSEWAIVGSPNTSSTKSNLLNSVACGSESDCWAVGYYTDDSNHLQRLIERWNGNSWIIVPSPNNGMQESQLNGVTCPLATDCRAVGYYTNSNGISQTLVEQWNGSSWEIVPSANTDGTHHNRLNSVTCLSASDCWAVGIHNDDTGVAQTLIEHWTPPVQLVSAVSRKVHGSAGAFDIDLPLTSKPGIECRSGGASGAYQVIATFASPVTMKGASVMYGSGSASSAAVSGSQVTVNLTGVTNAQITIVRIAGVNDGTNSASVDIPLGVLLGDTTANGSVNASDLGQTKSASGRALTASNFREDVTADGVINASDTTAVKAASGTALQ